VRLVVVDGPSGSGKSTVARELAAALAADGVRVTIVPTDHFATWADPVSWWPRLVSGVLEPLRAGRPGRYQRMSWEGGGPEPGGWVDVPVPDVLVVEGVSAGRASVRPLATLVVWVDLPDAVVRLDRAVARDGERFRAAFAGWQRFESGWFAVDDTRAAADPHISRSPGVADRVNGKPDNGA
jgi:energy-coupling factor transporter ATP-binding protein EcfA2